MYECSVRYEFPIPCYNRYMFALSMQQFEELVPGIVSRLNEEFGQCVVYLFGSRASGTAKPDSDIDLLVVVPDATDIAQLTGRAYSALRSIHAPKDIMVYPAGRFAERAAWPGSFEAAVIRKGRLLHAA